MITQVAFPCPECGQQIEEEIYVPEPNYAAERSRDSTVEHEEYVTCTNCEKEYTVDVFNSFGGLDISVSGVSCEDLQYDQPVFDEHEYEDDPNWYHDTPYSQYYDFFKYSAREIENMLNVDGMDAAQRTIFLRLLFVQSITIMETYLGDTLKAIIFQEDAKLNKFLSFDEEMKKTKLTLAEIAANPNAVKNKVGEYLSELMYHNLAKIGILYKGVLGIEFDFHTEENSKKIFQAIKTRHDCVHRNGKTKEGVEVTGIDEQYIEEILSVIEKFVDDIEDKITKAKTA